MRARLLKILAEAALVAAAGGPLAAQTSDAPTAPARPTESQRVARELLLEMARFVGGTQKYTVALRAGFDVVQSNGQKIEFSERRDISVARPNNFRSEHRESNGRADLLLFDGQTITISAAAAGVYARAPQPGDLDASIVHFVRDLKMRLPIAPLFLSRFAQELESRVREVDYVEQTDVLGPISHHLAGRTDDVDFQVWVRDGEQPVPLRIILTYRTEEGEPQFWADFTDWNLKPRFGRNNFVFEPPEGSSEIVFLAEVVGGPQSASAAAPQGPGEKAP
jgi:hypothetical protein